MRTVVAYNRVIFASEEKLSGARVCTHCTYVYMYVDAYYTREGKGSMQYSSSGCVTHSDGSHFHPPPQIRTFIYNVYVYIYVRLKALLARTHSQVSIYNSYYPRVACTHTHTLLPLLLARLVSRVIPYPQTPLYIYIASYQRRQSFINIRQCWKTKILHFSVCVCALSRVGLMVINVNVMEYILQGLLNHQKCC